jgi:hypothetical protein
MAEIIAVYYRLTLRGALPYTYFCNLKKGFETRFEGLVALERVCERCVFVEGNQRRKQ